MFPPLPSSPASTSTNPDASPSASTVMFDESSHVLSTPDAFASDMGNQPHATPATLPRDDDNKGDDLQQQRRYDIDGDVNNDDDDDDDDNKRRRQSKRIRHHVGNPGPDASPLRGRREGQGSRKSGMPTHRGARRATLQGKSPPAVSSWSSLPRDRERCSQLPRLLR